MSKKPQSERGYVLVWVIVLMMVASFVLGPFLVFMATGIRASHSYADTMAEFYAADSGIEDALYKIQYDFSATASLDGGISSSDDSITVDSTAKFPERGIVQIDSELIYYNTLTDTEFNGLTRGYYGTSVSAHDDEALATAEFPSSNNVGETWEYGIEDINGKQVDIIVENLWTLEGLESDVHGTMPHQELVVVGQVLKATATTLTSDIDDNDTTITVSGTASFPQASGDDPSVIRIEDELIRYTGKTGTQFTGCIRGVNGTDPMDHNQNTEVTSEEIKYHVDVIYDNSVGVLKIDRVGAWLPVGFNYVAGSSNVTTELRDPILSSSINIPVVSTELFPDSGVIAIEHELVYYDSKNSDTFEDCIRGYGNTTAAGHLTGTSASAEPEQSNFRGGTALIWNFKDIRFQDLPRAVPLGGGSQPRDEFPVKRTVTFSFSPNLPPTSMFSWTRTNRNDIYLSWDTSGGTFKVSSTATDPSTGTHTTINASVGQTVLIGGVAPVFGDSRAIGNSLVRGTNLVRRDQLENESSAFIDSAHGNVIPDDARVEAAYLYWTGWKNKDEDYDTEQLAQEVDQVVFNGTPITADRVQILQNVTSLWGHHGWGFSSFKDVTSLLEPEQVATITISPIPGIVEDVDIHWISGQGRVRITALTNLDDMILNMDPFFIESEYTTPHIRTDSVSPLVLTSGTSAGTYEATIDVTHGEVEIGGVIYGTADEEINITLVSSDPVLPPVTITKITTDARIDILNNTPNDPIDPDNNIDANGTIIEPEQEKQDIWLNNTDPSVIVTGAAVDRSYNMEVTCTDGMVKVEYGSYFIALGEPGSRLTNGQYTVGLDSAEPFIINETVINDGDLDDEWSHAGWSLIVIYSHPDEPARQFFLYDDYTYVGSSGNNFPEGYLEFSITGFQAPEDFEGHFTNFVAEGDEHYSGEYVQINGNDLSDAINPPNNPMNSKSNIQGIGVGEGEGVDIDSYNVSNYINEGDTAATLKMDSGIDVWNIVYIFLSFDTEPPDEILGVPVGIITFSFGGG
ncbi:hypothetical protein ACFLTP_04485 [Chloroflexota bacterium]